MADNFRFNKYFSAPVTLNIYAWLALSFLIFWVINPGNQNMEFKVILLASKYFFFCALLRYKLLADSKISLHKEILCIGHSDCYFYHCMCLNLYVWNYVFNDLLHTI